MAKISDVNENKLNSGLEKLKKAADNSEKEKIKIILKELCLLISRILPKKPIKDLTKFL